MKHILVTGGNGFIGRYVVEELEQRGYEPYILDRKFATDTRVYFGDIKDAVLVDDAVGHVDGVIHLAGILGTQETVQDPIPAATTNILGGLNVLEACAKYDVPLVNIAVGNFWMNNTYSITKSTIERFVDMYVRFRGARMSVVRALNAYGPRQVPAEPYGPSRVRKIMPSFICRALSGRDIEVYGDGEQVMDMIYVTDVAKILVSALERTAENPGGTYEAGTGVETTVNDIAYAVSAAVTDLTGNRVNLAHLPMRPGEDARSIVLGNPDTLEPLGMSAETLTPLRLGVARTVEYYQEYMR